MSSLAERTSTGEQTSSLRLARAWFSNPWARPRFLPVVTWLYVLWSIVPMIIAIQFSFNAGRSRSTWQGFSLRWYLDDPDLSLLHNPLLRSALGQSLKLALFTMVIATPIGVALALGLARWRGRGSGAGNFLMLFPLVTPELVMGSALFIVFTTLLTFVGLGTPAQLLGHVTFSISYVVIVVRGRLFAIGKEFEEAAMDLGASPVQALRLILLPMLAPAVFAALMIVFAISIDDFVISQFLKGGANSETVPILIYSNVRAAPTPALNALATIMLMFSMLAIAMAILFHRRFAPGGPKGQPGESAVRDFARLEI
ncbi:MAG TPA: ABC transporter permease [Actinomycetota bacterium]|nr:ABC transporter permease [Actinomycetota bacterium]